MIPKLIKTEDDYTKALNRIEQLYSAETGSAEGDELELLITLVELYEERSFQINMPDPITAIKFRMEQQGLMAEGIRDTFRQKTLEPQHDTEINRRPSHTS